MPFNCSSIMSTNLGNDFGGVMMRARGFLEASVSTFKSRSCQRF